MLSYYFPPDIGPGPTRAQDFVRQLESVMDCQSSIHVYTTFPNRYKKFDPASDEGFDDSLGQDRVELNRIRVRRFGNGILSEIILFLQFISVVLITVRKNRYDAVFATSSRLATALVGVCVGKQQAIPVYLDMRDLFLDTAHSILSPKIIFRKQLLKLIGILEAWTFRCAKRINVVTPAFIDYVRARAPHCEISSIMNGIDEAFLNHKFNNHLSQSRRPITMLYAGNVGHGQMLDKTLPILAECFGSNLRIDVVGSGNRRDVLEEKIIKKKLTNLVLHDPVPQVELFYWLEKADILFLQLDDKPAFEKVLPSKIFEYAATGKPILAVVKGFAASFCSNIDGVFIANIEDIQDISAKLLDIGEGQFRYERTEFCQKYSRKEASNRLVSTFLSMVRAS